MSIVLGFLINKVIFTYILLSLSACYINFIIVKRLFSSKELAPHFIAIIISMTLSFFHLYVYNFGEIPFLKIKLDNYLPLYYISFYLSFISLFPYIIARRLYT